MRAQRRYRLGRAGRLTLAGATLAAVLAATAVGGPPTAAAPAAAAPAASPAAGTPERVTRLRLGDLSAPAAGVAVRSGPPAGAPLAEDVRPTTRDATPPRTLLVRRETVPRFAAVAVTWAATSRPAQVSVAVRVRRDGAWTAWQAAGPARGGPDPARAPAGRAFRDGADLQWWGPADGLEVAVSAVSGPPPADVAVDLIDPGERPGDATAGATASATPARAERAPASSATPPYLTPRVKMPPIVRRAGWGANERKMGWTPEYLPWVKAATLHHTATTNRYGRADVPKILRSIYHFHAVSRGWGDIGYNVLVDRFGRLWEGRFGGLSRAVIGGHAGGFNAYTTGVSLIGDHRATPVSAASREAVARFLAWKFSLGPAFDPRRWTRLTGGGRLSRFPPNTTISAPRIFGHRRTNPTECPGARGMAALPGIRKRTRALMGIWVDPTALRTRLTVWRPSTATWHVRGVAGAVLRGAVGDRPVAADYDGDGTTDLATWTPSTGVWRIRSSAARALRTLRLGDPGHRPAPADLDGDGRVEPMTWDPDTGLWHHPVRAAVRWGALPDDVPVPGDYDGDGRADLAVWRPGTGVWHIRGVGTVRLGDPDHRPVPADYNGDGRVEPATWDADTHRFHLSGRPPRQYGLLGTVAVPGPYDGDAPAELAVWGAAGGGGGRWLVEGIGVLPLGTHGDQPIPAR